MCLYRETTFESNIKWFLFGTAGLFAVCHFILLFTEFSFFTGIGMLFNGLYHLVAVGCSVLVFYLFFKRLDNKEVLSSYALGLFNILGAIVDICVLVKYILLVKDNEGFKIWLVVLGSVSIIIGVIYSILLVRYGLDKITSVLPLLCTIIACLIRGSFFSNVESKLMSYAYNEVNGSIFSIWMFMGTMFYFMFVVFIFLYLDSGFLLELLQNPKDIFSSNTIKGTYTNLYMNDTPKNNKINQNESSIADQIINTHNQQVVQNQNNQQSQPVQNTGNYGGVQEGTGVQNSNYGKCPDCGNYVLITDKICNKCGCPLNTDNSDAHFIKCPDCGEILNENTKTCTKCGCPL